MRTNVIALAIGLADIEERCRLLARRLRDGLSGIADVTLRDLGRNPSAIVSFTVEGTEAGAVVARADAAGITIGASDPASTRIDAEKRRLPDLVRASPHYYNTEDEVDRLVEFCAKLRKV